MGGGSNDTYVTETYRHTYEVKDNLKFYYSRRQFFLEFTFDVVIVSFREMDFKFQRTSNGIIGCGEVSIE